MPRISSPSAVSSASASTRLDQAVEALAVAVAAEVVESAVSAIGRLDEPVGVEHQTKSEPPSTLMLAPVT